MLLPRVAQNVHRVVTETHIKKCRTNVKEFNMTGENRKITITKCVMPAPDTSSQDATDAMMGTDSVTDAIREQIVHEREEQARKKIVFLQQKACQEVEDYINHYLVNTM